MSRLEILLLGPPRIERDGTLVKVDTRKAIALVAYLASTGEAHRRDTLASLMWPESDQTRARAALRRTLSSLNRALNGEGLIIERDAIGLGVGALASADIVRFRSLLDQRLTHGHPATEVCDACVVPALEAVQLCRGDFLAGFTLRDSPDFDDWQRSQAESVRQELSGALDTLVRCHAATGQFEQAVEYARRWVALDPLAERSNRELMKAYGWAGRRADAQRQYRDCVRIMDRELGVPPLEETTRLYREIMEGGGPPPPTFAAESTSSESANGPAPEPTISVASKAAPRYPLVGRVEQWDRLLRDYESVGPGGRLVVLQGESGVGKTRLAEDFVAHVKARGAVALTARCYEGESTLAYGPFVSILSGLLGPEPVASVSDVPSDWLSEASRLLPGMRDLRRGIPAPQPLETAGAQVRFFEALGGIIQQALLGTNPGVLLIDDLQWADDASLEILTYLVRRLHARPILVLLAFRGDLALSTGAQLLLTEARRSDLATILEINRLDLESTVALTRAAAGETRRIPEGFAERMHRETEGLPLFLVEYIPVALGEMDRGSFDWEMPRRVRDLLLSRVSALSETGTQLLDTAAVIGRQFEFDTVQQASGRGDDEAVTAMEELSLAGLVREVNAGGTPTYDFAYDQLRNLVYEEISLARRRLLHRRVAEALSIHSGSRAGEPGHAAIARHYQMAGKDLEAAESFRLAGVYARELYANIEALGHFRSALELGHSSSGSLQEAIGDIQTLLGEFTRALAAYESAAAVSESSDLGRIERKIGAVHHRRGDWALAEKHYESSESLLNASSAAGEQARLYADWSLTAHRTGDQARPRELAQRAAEMAEISGETLSKAQAHNILGVLARNEGDFESAYDHLGRSLELAHLTDDRTIRIAALNNLALAYGSDGRLDQAIDLTVNALELCAEQGDRHRQAALYNNLADLYHRSGKPDETMRHLELAVTIFSELGADAGTMLPEVWKLVEW